MNPLKKIHKKIFEENKKPTAIVGYIIIFIVIAAVFSYEASGIETMDAKEVWDNLQKQAGVGSEREPSIGTLSEDGRTSEKSTYSHKFSLEHEFLTAVSASLSWKDEDAGIGRTNAPDEFKITLVSPTGESVNSQFVSNSATSGEGAIPPISMSLVEDVDHTGEWEVIVEAGDCGDYYGRFGYVSYQADDGNDWTLSIEYKYFPVE